MLSIIKDSSFRQKLNRVHIGLKAPYSASQNSISTIEDTHKNMAYCAEYQRPISVIDQVLHRKDNCWFTEEQNAEFEERFKRIKKRLEDPRLYIAMVGDFNAGKSTFLNRMVKLDILKVENCDFIFF